MQLGFAKAIIKSHQEKKKVWPWAREAPQNFDYWFLTADTRYGTRSIFLTCDLTQIEGL